MGLFRGYVISVFTEASKTGIFLDNLEIFVSIRFPNACEVFSGALKSRRATRNVLSFD